MANTPTRLSAIPFNEPGDNPVNPATYVNAAALSQSAAAAITVPANGNYVRLIGTADFYYSFTGTAAVPGTVNDGSASELINVSSEDGRWLSVPSGTSSISAITAASGGAIVVASFYTV